MPGSRLEVQEEAIGAPVTVCGFEVSLSSNSPAALPLTSKWVTLEKTDLSLTGSH